VTNPGPSIPWGGDPAAAALPHAPRPILLRRMSCLVGRLYSRRIINVNVNIVVAGLLAMGLTLIPVHLTRNFTDNKFLVWGITVGFDVFFDVVIYYALHWLANHMPHRRKPVIPGVTELSFLRDASWVQFERAMLGPVYYGIFSGLQLFTLHRGWEREKATIIGIGAALVTTRIMHTLWMIYSERRAIKRRQRAAQAAAPAHLHTDPAQTRSGAA
jgi:hypothetical protein